MPRAMISADEDEDRRIVAGEEAAETAAPRLDRRGRRPARGGGADRGAGDVLLGDLVAGQRARRRCRARRPGRGRRGPGARPRRTRGPRRRRPCWRRRGGSGRARSARRHRRRGSARRRAAPPVRVAIERANSTFCWLPPERCEMPSSGERALIDERLDLVDRRARVSLLRETKPKRDRTSSTSATRFSRIDSDRNRPSEWRSPGR